MRDIARSIEHLIQNKSVGQQQTLIFTLALDNDDKPGKNTKFIGLLFVKRINPINRNLHGRFGILHFQVSKKFYSRFVEKTEKQIKSEPTLFVNTATQIMKPV